MESEQFSLSLPPSPGHHRANSPVQFSRGCLAPSPEARDAVSFGLEDILYTSASDSEDFRAVQNDNDGYFPLGVGNSFQRMTSLQCLVKASTSPGT